VRETGAPVDDGVIHAEWKETKVNAPNHGLDTSAMMLCIATIAGIIRYKPPEAIKP